MRRFIKLPSPAMVVACIALFVSMGGVSYGLATGSIDSARSGTARSAARTCETARSPARTSSRTRSAAASDQRGAAWEPCPSRRVAEPLRRWSAAGGQLVARQGRDQRRANRRRALPGDLQPRRARLRLRGHGRRRQRRRAAGGRRASVASLADERERGGGADRRLRHERRRAGQQAVPPDRQLLSPTPGGLVLDLAQHLRRRARRDRCAAGGPA